MPGKFLAALTAFLFVQAALMFGKTAEVIYFNDFHGNALEKNVDEGYYPGMVKFMAIIEKESEKGGDSAIVVSGGDNYQGSYLSSKSRGAIVGEMLKSLHVKASAVGNHEFDWGADLIKGWQKAGGFDYLAANIIDRKTGKPVAWAKPYEMYDVGSVKIAFIGLATIDTPLTTLKKQIADFEFTNSAKAAQQWIDFLKGGKDKRGKPDVIIALTHIPSSQKPENGDVVGNEISDLSKNTKGLDVILSAHSHQFVNGRANGIPVIQAGAFGKGVGFLKISMEDGKLEKIVPAVEKNTAVKMAGVEPSQAGAKIVNKYMKKYAECAQVIGVAKENLTRVGCRLSALGRWVAATLQKSSGVQIALVNKSALRADLTAGNITVADILEVFPFDNTVVKMKLRGDDLIRALENANTRSYGINVQMSRGPGNVYKVISARVDGKDIKADEYYTVAVTDFMYTGGDGYEFKGAREISLTDNKCRDVLIDQVKKVKAIKAPPADCVVVVAEKPAKKAA